MDRRSQDGPQLPLEHLQYSQTEANTPQSQHRILRLGKLAFQKLWHFIGPNVQSSDHDGKITAGLDDTAVGLIMIRFRRFTIAAEEQKFRSVQSNTVCTAFDALTYFFGKFNIATDGHSLAVLRFGRQCAHIAKSQSRTSRLRAVHGELTEQGFRRPDR